MKKVLFIVLFALAILLSSCNTCDVDSYSKSIAPLLEKWDDADKLALSSPRITLSDSINNLQDIKLGKSQQKIITNNSKFSIEIKPLLVTEELEALYSLYTSSVSFHASASVSHFLYDEGQTAAFDTHVIEIRDNNTLIAAGIFDKGNQSIAGLINFYHPDYKKYSLGKYLMLLKINHARTLGKTWYYPGYIIYGNPKFDYKLFADQNAADIYLPEFDSWICYDAALIDTLEKGTLNGNDEE